MKRFVLDASVAAKWCFPEADSAIACRLLDRDIMLYAPDLLYAEVGNVAWKQQQRKLCTLEQAGEALALLRQVSIAITPVADLMVATLKIAAKYNRSFYDAAYLALALELDVPLVTADAKFANAMSGTTLVGKMVSLPNLSRLED